MPARLHKYLASCGLGSRRSCEELITSGRVTVNGETVTKLGTQVGPGKADVRVDGRTVVPESTAYFILHKPPGYLSTTQDRRGRSTVLDLVSGDRSSPGDRRGQRPEGRRLFIAGRLDLDSEGLMLITNDGDLTDLLTHPRFGVPKTYRVTVTGELTWQQLRRLREGVALEDGPARAVEVKLLRCGKRSSKADVTVVSGRKRMVRRMFAELGFKVTRLRRIGMGVLALGRLARGAWRRPTGEELRYFHYLRLRRSHQTAVQDARRKRGTAEGKPGVV